MTGGRIWRLTPTYAHGVCNLLGPDRIHLIADVYGDDAYQRLAERAQMPPRRPSRFRRPRRHCWLRAPAPPTDEERRQAAAFVADRATRVKTCTELLIEHLVLAVLLHKRIQRGQRFVAYAEWHLLHTATKDLIKATLAPASRYWGWYQLREEIALTPIGRACLVDLDAAVTSPAVPTTDDVEIALDRVLALVERACPNALDGLSDAITAYRTYRELA
ncbi:hypothetical protein ACH4JS_13570 [Streptomyces sp. NPDC017638]|uniref:hypothetical protein n=1 Tax=Streptomyces sp. NPDC017638 TaxID=3365004 RepID=UPI00378E13CC